MSFTATLTPDQLRKRTKFTEQFGHRRANHAAPVVPAGLSDEDAALLTLTAEVSFVARHAERLEKIDGLREAAAHYFDAYFTQIAEGTTPRMVFEEEEITSVAQGARAGDFFISEMNGIANDLLRLHTQAPTDGKHSSHHLSR